MMSGGSRAGERHPASIRIKLRYPDVETFIQKYAMNISRGGIFINTKTPKPVGSELRFEFLLAAGEVLESIIRGEGEVQWVRQFDPAQPAKLHGMGIRFTQLDGESQAVIERALAWRAAHGPPVKEPNPVAPVTRSLTQRPDLKGVDVDQLAAEYGLSSEQLGRTLSRRGHVAASELDDLLHKPPLPQVTRAEATAYLQALRPSSGPNGQSELETLTDRTAPDASPLASEPPAAKRAR